MTFRDLPASGVEDVEVGVADGGTVGLVGQVCRPPGQGCHPPFEIASRSVSPGAGIAIERTLSPNLSRV